MGAMAPSLRRFRWLKLVCLGLLATISEVIALSALGNFVPSSVGQPVGIWFMWAAFGGVFALLPVAWVLERWTRPRAT